MSLGIRKTVCMYASKHDMVFAELPELNLVYALLEIEVIMKCQNHNEILICRDICDRSAVYSNRLPVIFSTLSLFSATH